MKKSDEKRSALSLIFIIAGAIVVAAGVIFTFKHFCDKYKITERKSKKKFIDFTDDDEWCIDECDLGLDSDSDGAEWLPTVEDEADGDGDGADAE